MTGASVQNHPSDEDRPLVSILLVAYNQEQFIADAVQGALNQTYEPLEIIISDDASSDGTFLAIENALLHYSGPHRVVIRRNTVNLGISAHLSLLAELAHGELLFVAAGDDISLPTRCDLVVRCWIAHGRVPDLIASDLMDMDRLGNVHGRITPTDLAIYQGIEDWVAQRPWVVGASHVWTRRLFDRFGPMMSGVMAEDLVMTLRAIFSGGAISLRDALVNYRRGGLSSKRYFRSVTEKVAQMRRTNLHTLIELSQIQCDADRVGLGERMRSALAPQLAREQFTRAMFESDSIFHRLGMLLGSRGVGLGHRVRILFYATLPFIYAPLFRLKWTLRRRHGNL
ncbi:MAG: glycosyltransferase family 2 protein [Acidiferrobacteraceae bacterium]